jgi:hypothetical protein
MLLVTLPIMISITLRPLVKGIKASPICIEFGKELSKIRYTGDSLSTTKIVLITLISSFTWQPMSTQEMWSFIHYQYGDDLGPLSSDDEDYVQPAYLRSYKEVLAAVIGTEEDDQRLAEDHAKFPVDSLVDSTSLMINTESALERPLKQIVIDNPANDVNADVSSSSGSDHGDEAIYIPAPPVNGQTFIDHEFRIPFDQLFLVMFSESKLLKVIYPIRSPLLVNLFI